MQTRRIMAFGACALLAGAASCGLDSAGTLFDDGGTDATTDGADAAQDVGADASADGVNGDGAGDGSTDADVGDRRDAGADARVDAGPCADASLALCDEDAAACAPGTLCTPPLPLGWEIVSIDAPCTGAYASRWADAATIQFASAGPAACTCACNATAPGSCAASADVFTGPGCAAPAGSLTAGTCNGPIVTVAGDGIQIVRAQTPATCAPAQTVTAAPFDAGDRAVCTLSGAAGLCQDHSYCAPSNGAAACVAKAGAQTCPAGFTSITMSTGATDTRDCTPCACDATMGPCTGLAIFKANGGCNGGTTFSYDGGCLSAGTGTFIGTLNNNKLAGPGQATSTCVLIDAGGPTGSLAATAPFTVCCRP